MRVLITGGLGYVGSALSKKIISLGHDVTIVDIDMYRYQMPEEFEKATILREDVRVVNWDAILSDKVDVVYHLAGVSNDMGNGVDEETGMQINYDATVRLYNKCKEYNVGRFIYPSSCSVFGESENTMLDESAERKPITLYGKSKTAVELFLLSEKEDSNVCTTIIRPATVFGISSRQRFDLLLNKVVVNSYFKNKIKVSCKDNIRPCLYINDLINIYVLLAEADPKKIHGQVFNIAYDNITIGELVSRVYKKLGINEQIIDFAETKKNSRNYIINSDKIEKMLGVVQVKSVDDGVDELVEAMNKGRFSDFLDNANYYNSRIQPLFFSGGECD